MSESNTQAYGASIELADELDALLATPLPTRAHDPIRKAASALREKTVTAYSKGFQDGQEARALQAPARYCATLPNGDCVSADPRCMHAAQTEVQRNVGRGPDGEFDELLDDLEEASEWRALNVTDQDQDAVFEAGVLIVNARNAIYDYMKKPPAFEAVRESHPALGTTPGSAGQTHNSTDAGFTTHGTQEEE